jgi:hypothetical protein
MTDRTRDVSKMIFLGNFEEGVHHLTIPAGITRPVVARLDAEHAQREREASRAKLSVMQAARGRAKLKRALTLCFGFKRGRRGR